MNRQIWGEGRPLSKAEAGATVDASPEARLLTERISYSKVLVSGWGKRVITISYANTGWGGAAHSVGGGGGGKKGSWSKLRGSVINRG